LLEKQVAGEISKNMKSFRNAFGSLSVLTMSSLITSGSFLAAAQTGTFGPQNPFYAPSTLPFEAPPFDKIKDSDFQPAIDAGIAEQLKEVEAIANNPAPPTFDNTLVALEKSGQLLNRVSSVFSGVAGANTDEALEKVLEYEAPRQAALSDAIYLNTKLFARVKSIYDQRESLHLDAESLKLLDFYYKLFIHSGANLSDADKETLKKINEEDSTLQASFINKLLAATKAGAYFTSDASALAGYSPSQLAAAAQAAEGRDQKGWLIPLQNTTQQPDLTYLTNRATRQKLFENSWTRTERGDANDTRQMVARMAQLRAQKAALLGYPDYAAWTLTDQMAKTPETALHFVEALAPAATARAAREAKDIQALILSQNGSPASLKLEPWDWNFYQEQVRKARYDLNESEVKQYFELNNVLENGVFYAAHQLYGLTFKERHDIPVYQPDVRVFEVFNADGSPLALFYCDYFKRDNKNGGAWMSNFVNQSKLLGELPVVFNVANFDKPLPGEPALIGFDDVITMFHEFGHGLHGMFANTMYPSLSGTQTARDFVEFPSQFNEHWASYPEVFNHYARHYKTGEPMPAELAAKLKKSNTFNQGYMMTELLAAAELDLKWHSLAVSAPAQDPDAFEKQALEASHLWVDAVPPRYRSSYFLHIWANGYAAGYYAYLWTEMLCDDAFQWFLDNGGLTRANGDRFRQMVLSRGNTEDLEKMYSNWLGAEPSIEPMLKFRGLKDESPQ
jgi:peptidyl-dipeptidase Dcp